MCILITEKVNTKAKWNNTIKTVANNRKRWKKTGEWTNINISLLLLLLWLLYLLYISFIQFCFFEMMISHSVYICAVAAAAGCRRCCHRYCVCVCAKFNYYYYYYYCYKSTLLFIPSWLCLHARAQIKKNHHPSHELLTIALIYLLRLFSFAWMT